jgi:hypothetical protein
MVVMNNFDITALENTIERYPWFSIAHLELFIKVSGLGEEQKLACLSRTASNVYSREKLYFNTVTEKVEESTEQPVLNKINNYYHTPIEDRGSDSFDVEGDVVVGIESEVDNDIESEVEVDFAVTGLNDLKRTTQENDKFQENEEITFEIETDPLGASEQSKIILVGGDYFGRKDFHDLELDSTKPLDKFIVEKPSLLRSNQGSNETQLNSAQEIELGENFEDAGFFTETLARIYGEQGFYKRALEVYAKLILIYPEKSTYFAALVQELKSKHNQ